MTFCFLKRSSNTGFASAVLKAVILLLLMGGVYEVRRCDGFRWHDITSFMTIDLDIQVTLLPQQFESL
jgi:hypothetical protein